MCPSLSQLWLNRSPVFPGRRRVCAQGRAASGDECCPVLQTRCGASWRPLRVKAIRWLWVWMSALQAPGRPQKNLRWLGAGALSLPCGPGQASIVLPLMSTQKCGVRSQGCFPPMICLTSHQLFASLPSNTHPFLHIRHPRATGSSWSTGGAGPPGFRAGGAASSLLPHARIPATVSVRVLVETVQMEAGVGGGGVGWEGWGAGRRLDSVCREWRLLH